MPIYLGLDCGGSSCRALALNEESEPVFLAQGGSANLTSTPEATLIRSLSRALENLPPPDYVCACFAGLQMSDQIPRAEQLLRKYIGDAPLRVEPDYAAALRACPEKTTVCVISGTGSIVCSRLQDNTLVRSGGGGYLLGDEGSGFRYGRAAILSYLRTPEASSDVLKDTLEKLFSTLDPQEITRRTYESMSPAALIAGAASALIKDAEHGISYAVETVKSETAQIAETVSTHIRKFHISEPQPLIGLAGSVWKKRVIRESFQRTLSELVPNVECARSEFPPAKGAALLAMEMDKNKL